MYDLYGKKLYLTKNYRLFDFIGFSLIFMCCSRISQKLCYYTKMSFLQIFQSW